MEKAIQRVTDDKIDNKSDAYTDATLPVYRTHDGVVGVGVSVQVGSISG